MPKRTFLLFIIVALALAACQGKAPANPTASPSTPAQTAIPQKVETPTAESVSTEPVVGEAPPGCTAISPRPTPGPTEQSLFAPVSDKDWTTGPKGAPVTLIEYSDFQ